MHIAATFSIKFKKKIKNLPTTVPKYFPCQIRPLDKISGRNIHLLERY
jgi:hypothetical protein